MSAQPSDSAAPRAKDSAPGQASAGGAALIRPRGLPSRVGWLSRRSLVAGGSLLAITWLVLVFGGALGGVNAATRRAEQIRAENAALQQRQEQGRAEIALIQTDAFLRQQARAYGMGERGERAFALEAGTPLMAPIAPLGSSPEAGTARSTLEEWLQLLFD